MALADHPYEAGIAGPEGTLCWKRTPDGYCCPHPRREHPGESPQQDGPVRSTVERLQEENAKLIEERENALDMLERTRYERDLLRERLNHLAILAREVSERVTSLMGVVLDA